MTPGDGRRTILIGGAIRGGKARRAMRRGIEKGIDEMAEGVVSLRRRFWVVADSEGVLVMRTGDAVSLPVFGSEEAEVFRPGMLRDVGSWTREVAGGEMASILRGAGVSEVALDPPTGWPLW